MTAKVRPDVSASRAEMFRECARKARHKYVDKWPDVVGAPARIGKAAHAAIERAIHVAIGAGAQACATGELSALDLRRALLDVGGREIETARELFDALGVLQRAAPIRFGRVLGVELPVTLEAEEVLVGGVWDLVHEITDEQDLACVEVVDWKTGEAPPMSQEEAEEDLQVGLYLDLLKAWVGPEDRRELRVSVVYLAHEDPDTGGPVRRTVYWDRDRAEAARLTAVADQRAMAAGFDEPRVGRHCGYCPYRDRCEAFAERRATLALAPVPPSLPALAPHELLRLRQRLKEVVGLGEKALVDVNGEVQARINAQGGGSLKAGGFVAYMKERATGDWPTTAIDAVALATGMARDEAWRRMAKVAVKALRDAARGVPAAQDALERYRPRQTIRWVEVREAPSPI